MIPRVHRRRNGKWIVQEKRARGLAGGIYRKVSDEYATEREARLEFVRRYT